MINSSKPFNVFWLSVWAVWLAFGWLIPNHYWPWSSFQSDLWVSISFSVACVAVLISSRQPFSWHWLVILAVCTAAIPWVQYFFGLLYFSGDAWLSSLFILGFALVIATGDRWESLFGNQAADGLFLAIGMGAIGSVALQLCQWLELDALGIWLVPVAPGRLYANFAQPNNLATFLLWGVIAVAWGCYRRYIRAWVAVGASIYLIFGIALTQSRTAFVGVMFLVLITFYWRNVIESRRPFYVSIFLLLLLIVSYKTIPVFSEVLQIGAPLNRFENTTDVMRDDLRLIAYNLFFKASLIRPWSGYGWYHVGEAFFAVVGSSPHVGMVFLHSHNLFLDLVLWTGWPIGLGLSLAIFYWAIQAFRAVDSVDKLLLFLFVAMMAWHAMLELPLHYAYFLLPFGFAIGVLNAKNRIKINAKTKIWPLGFIAMVVFVILCAIGRDYFELEKQFLTLRLERLRIDTSKGEKPVSPLLLNQLDGFLKISRIEPKSGISNEEIEYARRGVLTVFTPLNALHFIEILALNGKPEEAQDWVFKMQKALPERAYQDMALAWLKDIEKHPSLASIIWKP